MKFARTAATTFAPLGGFVLGLLMARLVVPMALYLTTLWVAWHLFGILGPPDLDHMLQELLARPVMSAPVGAWLAALACIVSGLVLLVLGRGQKAAPAAHAPGTAVGPVGQPLRRGIHRWLGHPQYTGCVLIMLGLLLPWPEPVHVLLFLIFSALYVGLAVQEERALRRRGAAHAGSP